LAVAGTVAGLSGALLLSGLMKSLLFGIGPHDPFSLILAPAVLMMVALVAAYVPGRRAAHISPVDALRSE
jgi:ABC-type antimicrobial peptide transport system permease subunit